jgi:hypothetical protein
VLLGGTLLAGAAAAAEPAAPVLLAEAALMPVAEAIGLPAGAPAWQSQRTPREALAAACAPAGAAPRLLLTTERPGRLALEGCRDATARRMRVEVLPLGRLAVAVVAPARGPVFALDAEGTFRSVAEAAPPSAAAAAPVRVVSTTAAPPTGGAPAPRMLAPAEGSLGWRVFAATALDGGCAATLGVHMPFGVAERAAACSALRGAATTRREEGDLAALRSWARQAPAGNIAVVTLPELRSLGGEVLPLPFDGVLPTIGNVASGAYPLAMPLHLVIVRPAGAEGPGLEAARDAAFEIMSERSLGPSGPVAALGVAPLPPAERVAARGTAFTLLRTRP